ncbi:MAG: aminotransferase class III-fold pyridoxal phosphate-dependent enzyme, partial [Methylobacteriaceae bacterium]|nr:aminotransferase class III-fold pyridoxal phosphate-dependent enzyme [Methylobacteriaceae bacterium]
AELMDRRPGLIGEIRGEGLMLGIKAQVPNGELVAAARAEKLLVIAAGDNVVRLIPPLIVEEPEVLEAVRRLDAACGRIERARSRMAQKGAAE